MILFILLCVCLTATIISGILDNKYRDKGGFVLFNIIAFPTAILLVICIILSIVYEGRRTNFVVMQKTKQTLSDYKYRSYKKDSINSIWGSFFPEPDEYKIYKTGANK